VHGTLNLYGLGRTYITSLEGWCSWFWSCLLAQAQTRSHHRKQSGLLALLVRTPLNYEGTSNKTYFLKLMFRLLFSAHRASRFIGVASKPS